MNQNTSMLFATLLWLAFGLAGLNANESAGTAPVPATTPVVQEVVVPEISSIYAGARFELDFVVRADGSADGFVVRGNAPEALVSRIVAAVSSWQFAPATRGGQPVDRKVRLPVVVTAPDTGSAYLARR